MIKVRSKSLLQAQRFRLEGRSAARSKGPLSHQLRRSLYVDFSRPECAQKAVIPRRCGEWVQFGSKGLYCSETIKVALTTARPRSTEMFCNLAG